jgi:hypothetical protein
MADFPAVAQNGIELAGLGRRERAAVLVAADELKDVEIAAVLGVGRRTLARWKTDPDFAALVGDHAGQIAASCLKFSIAKKHKRIGVLDDMHTRAVQVISDRAERYAEKLADADSATATTRRLFNTDVPAEAATGLLVEKENVNNAGLRTTEWTVDTGLMKEIRGLHEQAAKELGQWIEKSEMMGQMTTVVQIIRSGENG